MREYKRFSEKTPQQIRETNLEKRQQELAFDLRERFKAEYRYMAMTDEDKEGLRKIALYLWGYDPVIPMRQNGMEVRVVYHRHRNELIKETKFLGLFLELEEFSHMFSAYVKCPFDEDFYYLHQRVNYYEKCMADD